ncbi:MAG: M20/M25/M40 family metallo-hydrolase [Lachnospiraceae bacterium]|nr:M20/M25/M40 family metallo-hydrolase [Lachnospiraceae bacterium]
MNNLLDTELKTYIAENQDTLVKLLDTLCRIPAPSNHEELRAKFICDWFEKEGCKGAYVDSALNVIYPFHCEAQKDLVVFSAHIDTVFPDMEPFDVVYDGDIMRCPGVGDNTSNVAIMMLLASWLTKKNMIPKQGFLFVASSGEEGLGNLKGIRQVMKDYEGKIAELVALDGSYDEMVTGAVGSLRYRVGIHTEGGHSYGCFGNQNAIQALSSMINTLYSYHVPKAGKSTYNVGTISGGTSINTIAQYAEMRFEYRSDVRESLADMNKFFMSVIDSYNNMDNVTVECELLGERPCTGDVDEEKQAALVDKALNIIEAFTGNRVPCSSGSTDCNIPLSTGIPAICFGGHMGVGAHTREEHLNVKDLHKGMEIIAAFMMTYFK